MRPAAHTVARGTPRYAETLAFIAAWSHLKLEGVAPGKTYRDNALMQWLMQHGLWFHQVHRSSWLLPWHRTYLLEVERKVIDAWLAIRADDALLRRYGWPVHPETGAIVRDANHTDSADGVSSYIAEPRELCVAIPYWHHAHDAGHTPIAELLAPFDRLTFGGSGASSADGCVEVSQFGRHTYTVGDWGAPQEALPNAKAHAGYWGSKGRCLRRPYDESAPIPFLREAALDELLNRCDMPWVDWQAELERQVHDPTHDYLAGHMTTPISSHDPLFWLHHAGLDRAWTVWQGVCGGCDPALTTSCGSAASPLGYQRRSPEPKLWSPDENPKWAPRHASTSAIIYDDCGRQGCNVSGVHQVVSFEYEMPDCESADEDFDDDPGGEAGMMCDEYPHGCHDPLEPFDSWRGRPASSSRVTAASALDSTRFAHTCADMPGGGRRCDGVRYQNP